jgi:hypothetical protein
VPDDPPSLHITEDNTSKILATLKGLSNIQVLIGVPAADSQDEKGGTGNTLGTDKRDDDKGKAKGEEVTNSMLAYIHENGSPLNNIPARPFIKPGIENSKSKWLNYMEQAGKAAMEGNTSVMNKALHAAGLTALTAVKLVITSHIPPPLAPRTVAARKAKRKYHKGKVAATDLTPLVDTGQLINSLAYSIRRKK